MMDSEEFNPYAPPSTSLITPKDPPGSEFRIFRLWERYRLVYNLVLVVETFSLTMILKLHLLEPLVVVPSLLFYALAANVCFCAGPVLHYYAKSAGLDRDWVHRLIFGLGLVVAIGLVAITCWVIQQETANPGQL